MEIFCFLSLKTSLREATENKIKGRAQSSLDKVLSELDCVLAFYFFSLTLLFLGEGYHLLLKGNH